MYDAFEWDAGRSRSNIDAHGIDLESAATIFDGPVLARPDDRAAFGERRSVPLSYR